MRKIAFYIFTFIAFMVTSLSLVPNFFSLDKYKTQIIDNIQKSTGRDLKIDGPLKLTLLPSPRLTISKIELSNLASGKAEYMIKAEEIFAKFDFINFYKGNYQVNEININKGDVNFEVTADNSKNWDFLHNIFNNENNPNFKKIGLTNSKLNIVYSNGGKKAIDDVELFISAKKNSLYEVSGSIYNNSNPVRITSSINTNSEQSSTNFELSSDSFKLSGEGSVVNSKFLGKYEASISNLNSITGLISQTFPFIPTLDSKELLAPIKLEGNVDISENGISTNDLKITSTDTTGSGSFSFIIDNDPKVSLGLNFASINIDNLLKDKASSLPSSDSKLQIQPINFLNFDSQNQINVAINLSIENLVYGAKGIKDILVKFAINNNQLQLETLHANLPDNFTLDLSDAKSIVVDNENVLLGNISIKGSKLADNIDWLELNDKITFTDEFNNYELLSKLILAPSEITFLDINSKISDIILSGRWTTKIQPDNTINYDSDITIENIDFSKVSLPKLKALMDTFLLKTAKKEYLSEYKWFREFNGSYSSKIKLLNARYKDINFASISGTTKISQGLANFSAFTADTDIAKISDLKLDLDARLLTPVVKLSISGDKLDFNSLEQIYLGTYNNTNSLQASIQDQTNVKTEKWSNDPFSLFRFDKFSGLLDCNLSQLIYKHLAMNNLNFSGSISDSIFYIQNLRANLFDGELEVNGNFSLVNESPAVALSFALNKFELSKFITLLTGHSNVSGPSSMSGSLYTFGQSPREWAKNFSTNTSFVGSNLTLDGVDMANIIDIAAKRKYYEGYQTIEQIDHSLKNGSTVIDSFDGVFIAKDGKMHTENTTFKSYYSNAGVAASFNLTDWVMNTICNWTFLPIESSLPITTSFNLVGNVDKYNININHDALTSYIADVFNLKSKEQLEKEAEIVKQKAVEQKKNSKYIFEKLN